MKEALELLGLSASDKVTGFSGVITTASFDLYGCIQFVLTPGTKEDGTLGEGHWFDANRIVLTGDRVMPVPVFTENYILSHTKGPAKKPTNRKNI